MLFGFLAYVNPYRMKISCINLAKSSMKSAVHFHQYTLSNHETILHSFTEETFSTESKLYFSGLSVNRVLLLGVLRLGINFIQS